MSSNYRILVHDDDGALDPSQHWFKLHLVNYDDDTGRINGYGEEPAQFISEPGAGPGAIVEALKQALATLLAPETAAVLSKFDIDALD